MRRITLTHKQVEELEEKGILQLEDGSYITVKGGGNKESDDEDDELEEMNTTASAGGSYNTPYAFSKTKGGGGKIHKDYEEVKNDYLKEMYSKILEVTYNDFKNDDSMTNKQKINSSLKEISNQMYNIERTLKRISKLKTEMGADSGVFFTNTLRNFNKMSQRILKIGNYIRELNK